tara:strand:+ start:1251 stop:1367 length:117 start_codon:yes stop_codon:yes gene_type:complete
LPYPPTGGGELYDFLELQLIDPLRTSKKPVCKIENAAG